MVRTNSVATGSRETQGGGAVASANHQANSNRIRNTVLGFKADSSFLRSISNTNIQAATAEAFEIRAKRPESRRRDLVSALDHSPGR